MSGWWVFGFIPTRMQRWQLANQLEHEGFIYNRYGKELDHIDARCAPGVVSAQAGDEFRSCFIVSPSIFNALKDCGID